ncbi:MAG: right-handed parallel beta-helix repeat-containing protein [Polyangiaceae bacterium]
MTKLLRGSIALSILAGTGVARAEIIEVGPGDDVEAAMNALMPGDELVLEGGTYTLTDAWHITMVGTEQAPIVVRAKDGDKPHLQRPSADQNVIDFDMVRHATFRGIEVSGGSHGLRLIDVSFMTIEGCDIHDTGDVAISANSGGDYDGLRILRNNIHHTNNTGEGMYLGCNNDDCRVHDSLIEGNWVHHTNGPTIEQGDGIEIKEGSYGNVIRDNIIHDTNYPCILTYSTVGNGAPNIIERNAMWNCGDHGIQSAADAIIRNNIILGSGANGIAMQPHQSGAPSNLEVLHNTVLHPSNSAITVSGATGTILIANTAVYAQNGAASDVGGDLALEIAAGNLGVGSFSGPSSGYDESGDIDADFVSASYAGAPPMDVFPANGSALVGAGDPRYAATDDFNGTPRDGTADVGAYRFDAAGNPGWTLDGGFKDADASSSAATTGSGGGSSAGPAGAGGSSAVGPGAGNGGADAGADPEGAGDSGCSCRATGGHGAPPWPDSLTVMLGWLAWSRRRRSRHSR